jgi:hypothetical protein
MTRRGTGWLTAVCLLGVGVLALAPVSSSLNSLTVHLWEFFRTDVPVAPASAVPEDYGRLLNIAFFVPLAAATTLFLGNRWGWALPLCITLSVVIEVVQREAALGRDSSAVDVACNAVGATVGVVMAVLAREWRRRRAGPAQRE